MKAFQVEILKMLDSPCHLNMEIDLDEIIRRFARLHLRDLRRMELTNIQTPKKGGLAPELKSEKIPGGARTGGVLPYMGYIGMCSCEGYGFQVGYSRIGKSERLGLE